MLDNSFHANEIVLGITPKGHKGNKYIMYEVIWSIYNDAYVCRSVNIQSTIKPLFVGTLDQCENYIVKNTTC